MFVFVLLLLFTSCAVYLVVADGLPLWVSVFGWVCGFGSFVLGVVWYVMLDGGLVALGRGGQVNISGDNVVYAAGDIGEVKQEFSSILMNRIRHFGGGVQVPTIPESVFAMFVEQSISTKRVSANAWVGKRLGGYTVTAELHKAMCMMLQNDGFLCNVGRERFTPSWLVESSEVVLRRYGLLDSGLSGSGVEQNLVTGVG
jgi:hypothetical protein